MRNQRFCRLCGVGLTVFLAAGGVHTAQAQEVERFVKVLDREGEAVTDLGAGDFVIEHDGVGVEVSRVELIDQPLRVALIVDDADGAVPFFRYLRDFLPEFVRALPEGSEVGLVLLSGRPRLIVDFTDDRGAVLDQLAQFFVEEDRAAGFFAGLEETVNRWDNDRRWPVLAVVTTDGPAQRTVTDGRYTAFVERSVERGAIIHALGLFTTSGQGFQTGIASAVTRITGGWYDTVAGPSQSISERLAEMAAEISRQYAEMRNQYAVAYVPPPGTDPDAGISASVRRGGVRLSISANGRPRPAAPAVAAAGDVGNSREELFNQGEAAFAAGDSAEAADWYQKAHDRDQDWVKPLFKLGLVSLNLGDIEAAKQWFEQAAEADAGSPEGAQAAAILGSLP